MINLDDIENAFFFVSSAMQYTASAAVNKKTGEIYYRSELSDEDEFPDDVEEGGYAFVPHKNELDLGRDLVFEFVSENLPERYGEVKSFFRHAGAYSRYKGLLQSVGLLQKWYDFEDKSTKDALLEWCRENNLDVGTPE